MEIVESFRRICTCYLSKYDRATRMGINEIGEVVDFVVDDSPDILLGVVLCHLFAGQGYTHVDCKLMPLSRADL